VLINSLGNQHISGHRTDGRVPVLHQCYSGGMLMRMAAPKYDPPQPTFDDTRHSGATTAIECIPLAGPFLAKLYDSIVGPPIERRLHQWRESVAAGLVQLEREGADGFKAENLKDNEAFITILLQATRAAAATHHNEKLEALKNAVLNAAIGTTADEEEQLLFIGWVDRLLPWHIKILGFFNDPRTWEEHLRPPLSGQVITREKLIRAAFPELIDRPLLTDSYVDELHHLGLFCYTVPQIKEMAYGPFESATTDLGKKFVAFITAPGK
jgi:hypothetical protein